MSNEARTLRVGAFSAFYGDEPEAMSRVLEQGVDILVGDYLAELTMLILRKNQLRGKAGYAPSFVSQVRANVTRIAELGVKVVVNAGGLDPEGCAQAIREICRDAGVALTVAAVVGDNLRDELSTTPADEQLLINMDTGEKLDLTDRTVLTANAYLGGWPIVAALNAGADIVVCPRMTDASLVVGPAAWHFGWGQQDWDQLASAVVAGHVIECSGQATGGNYSRFWESPDLGVPGFPIAEIAADGSFVITKPAGTGGLVSIDSVKSQLFYEIGGPAYHNPDVIADLSSISIADLGDDRVRISDVRGLEPTPTTKLSLTYEGGYRNSMTVVLTGAHVPEKVAWLRRQVQTLIGGPDDFDGFRWTVVGPAQAADGDYGQSTSMVVITVRDSDPKKVGRAAFSDRIVQLSLVSIPGFYLTTPPQPERLYGVQWPSLVPKSRLRPEVRIDGQAPIEVPWAPWRETPELPVTAVAPAPSVDYDAAPTETRLLGDLVLTRSGDKGGSANIGVWTRSRAGYDWLVHYLTEQRLAELLPEVHGLRTVRHLLPNLLGMNFVITGYLEDGVSSCTRIDPQAKGLGEYLGSRTVALPASVARTI